MTTTNAAPHLGADFAAKLEAALPRLLAPGALPDDWDHRATTYDLSRFDSDAGFAGRLEAALDDIRVLEGPPQIRERLTAVGLPFDYARLGQPLSTVFELYTQSRTNAARCISFASVTKPWLAVIESPSRRLPVRIYAEGALPVSDEKKRALGCELHEHWHAALPPRSPDVLTLLVTDAPFSGDVQASAADAVCFPVPHGGMLLVRDAARIDPTGVQLIRKRTVAALLAADARAALERVAGREPTALTEATAQACDAKLRALFPPISDSAYFCTGLAAETAVFTAVGDVLGPEPVTLFYAQNGYGGTGQLIGELLGRAILPRPLEVMGHDASGRAVTLVDRVLTALGALAGAPACLFLETPTNPELQVHDFGALMAGVRAYAARWGKRVPIIVDTTLAPLYPIFSEDFAKDWPFVLVKSGSKYFTKGKATLGVVACASDPTAHAIVARARELGKDADSFARPAQLAELSTGLDDLVPRMAAISAHTIRLANGLKTALRARGRQITVYAISEAQVKDGLATGMLSFYLPPAPTTYPDLVDELVAYLLEHAPTLVKSRVSYGQSTGGGKPDYFYVINPEESTQGALSAEVKNAQKHDNVQICRVSVPEHADVDGLLAVMNGFFALKYG